MKKILILILTLLSSAIIAASTTEDQVKFISKLIYTYPDSANTLATELLIQSNSSNDAYGIVQANYILAFINEQNGEYGKAIIYYLESIRHAEKSSYDGVSKTLASLNKNCGVIFRKFKAFDLAEKYYLTSLKYAIESEDLNQQLSINYNLARVYRENGDELLSIEILEKYLPLTINASPMYFDYMNRLGLSYHEVGNYQKSIDVHKIVLDEIGDLDYEMKSYSFHNLGESLKAMKNYSVAEDCFNKSLQLAIKLDNSQQLFALYSSKGKLAIETGDLHSAAEFFEKAESIIPRLKNDPEYFKIYNDIANLHFNLDNFSKSKSYQDLYLSNMNDFITMQEKFQEDNRRDNIDLITKRYLDEVEKQEKIASILFYSRLTSGGLLTLLLLVIGYNRFEKIRVRKSIERQLIQLEMMD